MKLKFNAVTLVVAGDVGVSQRLLRASLEAEGYRIVQADSGREALAILEDIETPVIGVIDGEMTEMTGIEMCHLARQKIGRPPLYLILITNRTRAQDLVAGLGAGANDYVTKPFNQTELLARVNAGVLAVEQQQGLINRIHELEDMLKREKIPRDPLPVCSYCKKIRDDQDSWQQMEIYLEKHSCIKFSHGICPVCMDRHLKPELEQRGIKLE